jgi:hypothetical protein
MAQLSNSHTKLELQQVAPPKWLPLPAVIALTHVPAAFHLDPPIACGAAAATVLADGGAVMPVASAVPSSCGGGLVAGIAFGSVINWGL